jgi:hypothetical protein
MVVHEIAYGFGGPSEKKCQSSLIFYCKIPILFCTQMFSPGIYYMYYKHKNKPHQIDSFEDNAMSAFISIY